MNKHTGSRVAPFCKADALLGEKGGGYQLQQGRARRPGPQGAGPSGQASLGDSALCQGDTAAPDSPKNPLAHYRLYLHDCIHASIAFPLRGVVATI